MRRRFCRRPPRLEWRAGGSALSGRGGAQSYFLEELQMKARLFVMFAAASLTAASLGAQIDTQRCPSGTTAQRVSQDACQKAIDLFEYMAPQLGTSITGGNATLGQGGNLGGLGHFSFGLRVNAVEG